MSLHDVYNITIPSGTDPDQYEDIAYQKIGDLLSLNPSQLNSQDKKGYTILHKACQLGHLKIVSSLLKNHVELEIHNYLHQTPLHLAVIENHHDIVEQLIISKSNVNVQDYLGETPLHKACFYGHITLIDILLKNNAQSDIKNNHGQIPLHSLCELFDKFSSADNSHYCKKIFHLMERMILKDTRHIPVELFEKITITGIDFFDQIRLNPQHFPDHIKVIETYIKKYLGKNKNYDESDFNIHFVQNQSVRCSLRRVCLILIKLRIMKQQGIKLNDQDDNGDTLFHKACLDNDHTLLCILSLHNADCTIKNKKGQTPLHCAVQKNNWLITEKLIYHNVDLNAQDNQGHTALHQLCIEGNYKKAQFLFDHGAQLSIKNNYGLTPLEYLCDFFSMLYTSQGETIDHSKKIFESIVKMIKQDIRRIPVEYFQDIPLTDLHSSNDIEVISTFLKNYLGNNEKYYDINSNHNIRFSLYRIYFILIKLDIMQKQGMGINDQNANGDTLLHQACRDNNLITIYILLLNNADWKICNHCEETPLHCAAQGKNSFIMQDLIKNWHIGHINAQDKLGNTAFHYLCRNGHFETASFLIDNGAAGDIQNDNGDTALDVAFQMNFIDMEQSLRRKILTSE